MTIIHIYGDSGSGTSTLGKALQKQLHYTHLDTDDYYWEATNPPFTVKHPIDKRLSLLKRDLSQSSDIVISGSLCGWGDDLIPYFDLVIRLVAPTSLRIERLKHREFQEFKERILPGGDMAKEHTKFIQWASEYDDGDLSMRSKALHDSWENLIQVKHITLDSSLPVEKLIEDIIKLV